MSNTRPNTSVPTALLALAGSIAVLLTILLTAAPASASVQVSGSAAITIGTGKPGYFLGKQRARVSGVGPVRTNRKGRITRVVAPVSAVRITPSAVAVRGGVRFSRGKRRAVFTRLRLNVTPRRTVVTASLGKRRIVLFVARGNAIIDPVESKLNLTSAKLSLSGSAARLIRGRLRMRRLPAGPFGRLSLSAKRSESVPVVDPYLEQCGLAATSKRTGAVTPAGPLPFLTVPLPTDGSAITWAVKSSLNGYINGIGEIVGLDGATVNRIPGAPLQAPPTGFTFPSVAGQYAANGVEATDDQAVINGSGTVVYCNEPHGFRVAISNPTIVIDGANSRIIADLDTNITGEWTPTQRVDFADLNLSGVTPTTEPGVVTWTDIPTTLSDTGADALRFCDIPIQPGAPPSCLYPAGTPFDPITVVATTSG